MGGAARFGAVLLGMLVIGAGASAVSGASTPLRWFYCGKAVPKKAGAFADRGCSVPSSPVGTGNFELLEGIGKGKKIKLKGTRLKLVIQLPPGPVSAELGVGEEENLPIACATMGGTGRPVAPAGVAEVVLRFSKCRSLGSPCQSGAVKGVITTDLLAGQLGSLDGSRRGIDLANEAEPGVGPLARFTCTEVAEFTLSGSMIAEQVGDTKRVNDELSWRWTIGPYLGLVEYKPGHGYFPLVNPPNFLEGPDDYLSARIEKEGRLFGELPSGLIGEAAGRGEALEARE